MQCIKLRKQKTETKSPFWGVSKQQLNLQGYIYIVCQIVHPPPPNPIRGAGAHLSSTPPRNPIPSYEYQNPIKPLAHVTPQYLNTLILQDGSFGPTQPALDTTTRDGVPDVQRNERKNAFRLFCSSRQASAANNSARLQSSTL